MPKWDNKVVEEKATEIAKLFMEKQGSLHDLVVKESKKANLNEEMIRRLSRASNVKTFGEKFAERKKEADRMVDFELVDPEKVISELATKTPLAEKKAAAFYPKLADELASHRNWPTEAITKTASVDLAVEMKNAVPKPPSLEKQISTLTKEAQDLGVKLAGAELRWDASMEALLQHSKRLHWDRDGFEKNAFALFGAEAVVEVNELRKNAKLPPLDVSATTATKLAEHLFGEETEDSKLLDVAITARKDYASVKTAHVKTTTKLAELKAQVLACLTNS